MFNAGNSPVREMVAIVGASGSGKTTIIKLLLQELIPQIGQISIDGTDLYEISSTSLLSQIGMVLQNPSLFNMSIYENIRMGKLTATREEIINAAKKAQIHDDIMNFPLQYDTEVGQRSLGLSQGQAQRISIARALVANPVILLLDEVTSSLDPLTAAGIDEILYQMKGKYTLVFITHRLSSAIKADKIYVLNRGECIENGTHQQLIALNGFYKQLWDKQNSFVMGTDLRHLVVIPKWLKQIPLFASLNEEELNQLAKQLLFESVDADKVVFNQGEVGSRFYIILSGEVTVIKSDTEGHDHEVAKLMEGDYFGEVALLLDLPRTATIKTNVFCVFLTLHYHQFTKFFKSLSQNSQDFLMAKIKEYS